MDYSAIVIICSQVKICLFMVFGSTTVKSHIGLHVSLIQGKSFQLRIKLELDETAISVPSQ